MRFVETPGWEGHVTELAEQWRTKITEEIAEDARGMAGVDTGAMRASIHAEPPGRVVVGTDHWQFVEYGTRPHVIEPDEAGALAWPGGPHPAMRVEHPGTPERPFMRPALYRRRT